MGNITIQARDGSGSFTAYAALPKKGSGPGMIVIQEIFGINRFIRDLCDHYAQLGYVAVAPDLFWRLEPGVDLDPGTPGGMEKAFDLYGRFNVDKAVDDLAATIAALHDHDSVTGKIGCVGYCLGGKLAYLAATRTGIDASVGYYGVGIQDLLSEAGGIKNPLVLHIAEKDGYVPPEAQTKIRDALGKHSLVQLYSYPGADHAFARVGGDHYDQPAATLANQRTEEFFAKNLA